MPTILALISAKGKQAKNVYLLTKARFLAAVQVICPSGTTTLYSKSYFDRPSNAEGLGLNHNLTATVFSPLLEQYTKHPWKLNEKVKFEYTVKMFLFCSNNLNLSSYRDVPFCLKDWYP